MDQQRVFIASTLLCIMLVMVGCTPIETLTGAGQNAAQPVGSWRPDFITIQPLSVELFESDGDNDGSAGELQVFILLYPQKQNVPPLEMHFPNNDDNYYKASVRQPIQMGLYGLSVDRRSIGDSVSLKVIVADSDKINPTVVGGISVIANAFITLSPTLKLANEALNDFNGMNIPQVLLDWFQENEILGEYVVDLNDGNKWMTGGPQFVEMKNADGVFNVKFAYQIIGTETRVADLPDSQVKAIPSANAPLASEPDTALALRDLNDYLAFTTYSAYDRTSTIYTVRQGNLAKVPLDTFSYTLISAPAIAPNASRLVFTGVVAGRSQLYITDGLTAPSLLANIAGTPSDVAWYPDSQKVAFTLRSSSSEQTLQTLALDAPTQQQTLPEALWDTNGDIVSPDWKDNNLLYIVRNKNGDSKLQIRSSDGSAQFQMLMSASNRTPLFFSKWSPTGRIVSFVMSRRESEQKVLEESLYAFDLDRGEAVALVTMYEIRYPAWDPTGNFVVFLGKLKTDGSQALYVLKVKDGTLMRLNSDPIDPKTVTGIAWGK